MKPGVEINKNSQIFRDDLFLQKLLSVYDNLDLKSTQINKNLTTGEYEFSSDWIFDKYEVVIKFSVTLNTLSITLDKAKEFNEPIIVGIIFYFENAIFKIKVNHSTGENFYVNHKDITQDMQTKFEQISKLLNSYSKANITKAYLT